jgi:hypothetical protein
MSSALLHLNDLTSKVVVDEELNFASNSKIAQGHLELLGRNPTSEILYKLATQFQQNPHQMQVC